MVSINQIKNGLSAYADAEILPRLPVAGIKKVIVGTTVAAFINRGDCLIKNYLDNDVVKALGLSDGENIDIDFLRETLKSQMSAEGIRFTFPIVNMEMTLKAHDIDDIAEYIQGARNE